MRVVICGANGAMGKLLSQMLQENIAGCVSLDGEGGVPKTFKELGVVNADVIIDFSHHSAAADVIAYAKKLGCAVVIGTTGHTSQEKQLILDAAKELPVFYSGNMSMGIAVLCKLAKEAAACFPEADIEIVEIHHNRKVDAPSGTARMLFDAVKSARPELTEHCGRAGEGKRTKNEVDVVTQTQSLNLRPEAKSREMLAEGAVNAARFMEGKPVGLYTMQELLAKE